MRPKAPPKYLAGYPPALVEQVHRLIVQGQLAGLLLQKYPVAHEVRTDRALYDYVSDIKNTYLRNAGPVNKVMFDGKLQVLKHALGTHTSVSRVQGAKLQSKCEIRIASIFKEMPAEFLRMIVVHELAHIKERDHGKAFYQLCRHMEPDYHQLEFDLRAYLSHLDATGRPVWSAAPQAATPL
ncbi:MAG TPA: YgjP-like metallopeptidase domain-containing protein [Rhodocyclaceae bacterium]|nr:YgjP-like metallopeptidase domain-containing protein [Rhodocyclaceae bacterium]